MSARDDHWVLASQMEACVCSPTARKALDEIDQLRALADDIMDVLAHMVVGWEDRLGVDLAQHPEVLRVSQRYRDMRGKG